MGATPNSRQDDVEFLPAKRWAIGAGTLLALYYCYAVVSGLAVLDGPGGQHGFDYRDTVWKPLRDFVQGGVPWDVEYYLKKFPYAQNFPLYTPHYWWFMAPLVLMPYSLGAGAWAFLAAVALVWLLYFCMRELTPQMLVRWPWLVALGAVVLCLTRPGRAGILSCNWAVFCAVASALLLLPGWSSRASVALGLTALVKPQAGLAMLVEQVALRRTRVMGLMLGISGVLSAPILWITYTRLGSLTEVRRVLDQVLAVGDGPGTGPGEVTSTRVDLVGTVGHAMGGEPSGTVALTCVLAAGLLTFVTHFAGVRRLGPEDPFVLVAGGLGLCLVLPNQIYSVTALVPGIVGLIGILLGKGTRRLQAVIILVLLAPLFLNTGPLPGLVGLGKVEANVVTGAGLLLAAVVSAVQLTIPRDDLASEDSSQAFL